MSRIYLLCEPGAGRRGPYATRDGALGGAIAHALEQGARCLELRFEQADLALFELRAGDKVSAIATRDTPSSGARRGAPTLVPGWARVVGRKDFPGLPTKRLGPSAQFCLVGIRYGKGPTIAKILGPSSAAPKDVQASLHYALATKELPKEAEGYDELYLCWFAAGSAPRASYRRSPL